MTAATDRDRPAMSLLELLVVVAIVAVLVGMIASAVQHVRSSAAKAVCGNNLRQLAVAAHDYHGRYGRFPPGCSYRPPAEPFPHMGWAARLLPGLEQQPLWDEAVRAFAQASFFEAPPHRSVLGTPLRVVVCPADPNAQRPKDFGPFRVGLSSYLGVSGRRSIGPDGMLFLNSAVRLADVTDGTSSTLLIGERPPSADGRIGWWYAGWGLRRDGAADLHLGVAELNLFQSVRGCPLGPYSFRSATAADKCGVLHFWSGHPGGGHFALADGSVRFFKYSAAEVMPALASRAGGEPTVVPD